MSVKALHWRLYNKMCRYRLGREAQAHFKGHVHISP